MVKSSMSRYWYTSVSLFSHSKPPQIHCHKWERSDYRLRLYIGYDASGITLDINHNLFRKVHGVLHHEIINQEKKILSN